MNLAVRRIDADIRWHNEGSFHKDELKDKRFDFIMANPPFNVSDWGGDRLREDPRWKYGAPPAGNANYGWLQPILWHLAPEGTAGVVLAKGSMSSTQSGEDIIRRSMIEGDVIDCDLPPFPHPLITGVSQFCFGFETISSPPRLCGCGKRTLLSTAAKPHCCRNSWGVR